MTCRCHPANRCGKCDERPTCPKCQSPDLAPYRNSDPSWRWFAAITPGTDKAFKCMDCGDVSWTGSNR